MIGVRYTNLLDERDVRECPAPTGKIAKRLFKYAVGCATAEFRIDLVIDGLVLKSHTVNYEADCLANGFSVP